MAQMGAGEQEKQRGDGDVEGSFGSDVQEVRTFGDHVRGDMQAIEKTHVGGVGGVGDTLVADEGDGHGVKLGEGDEVSEPGIGDGRLGDIELGDFEAAQKIF